VVEWKKKNINFRVSSPAHVRIQKNNNIQLRVLVYLSNISTFERVHAMKSKKKECKNFPLASKIRDRREITILQNIYCDINYLSVIVLCLPCAQYPLLYLRTFLMHTNHSDNNSLEVDAILLSLFIYASIQWRKQ
jgi:hypothetical protein